jgi:hypothetical protein
MFEALGACRDSARKMREDAEKVCSSANESQAEIETGADTGTYIYTKELTPRKLLKRKSSWRARIKVMTLAEYRFELETEISRAQDFRRQQLRHRFPCATFETLDGVRWFGVSAEAERASSASIADYRWKHSTRADVDASLVH